MKKINSFGAFLDAVHPKLDSTQAVLLELSQTQSMSLRTLAKSSELSFTDFLAVLSRLELTGLVSVDKTQQETMLSITEQGKSLLNSMQ